MVRLLFVAALLVSLCLSCVGGSEQVRMGTEGAYEPYNFLNDAGEVAGFERDLGDELCNRADLECTWVTNDWDTIMAGMSITAERDEVIAAVLNGDADLREKFDQAITAMKEDDSLNALIRKWFDADADTF